jgi:glycogen debranching enzyme
MPEGGDSTDINQLQVLDGSTFMLSDPRGDVFEGSIAGLFHEDTRYLNRFVLTVGGVTPSLLTSDEVAYYSAAIYMTNPELDGIAARSLSVQRYRFVGGGVHEVITVRNHTNAEVRTELRLSCGSDFADLFEVKEKGFRKAGQLSRDHDRRHGVLEFGYDHETFDAATRIRCSRQGRIDGDDLVWDLVLAPREVWSTNVTVAVRLMDEVMEPIHQEFDATEREASRVLQKWQDEVPRLTAGSDLLEHVYRKSIVDLAGLRLHAEVEGNDYSLPAAGLPWFMAIFGRDTLITSYQSLLVGPELARGALHALASLQGTEVNDFKDEEPGKILHEIRFGELTALGEKPHRPYYGTADATPLWLVLLSEYWRITGDDACVEELHDNAIRALEWIDRYGDRDGDGYVEYKTRSAQGLRNQGWKDSWNGVLYRDGTAADPPIALCEIQGYAYDAKMRTAELAEKVWKDQQLAGRLRAEAGELRDRFNGDFWVEDRGGFYAIALAGEAGAKRVVDSMTSNMGHLLWSGIVPDDRAAIVAKQLLSKDMWSGWGVRTLSEANVSFSPITYHDGTVWPHDNSIIAAGLARYGFREEANRIMTALLEAAGFTEYRLPEVFAGYPRDESRFPVRYPTASSPQAWATGAPFLFLWTMLGLRGEDGKVVADPHVPEEMGEVYYHGFHAFGTHFDVRARGTTAEVTLTE